MLFTENGSDCLFLLTSAVGRVVVVQMASACRVEVFKNLVVVVVVALVVVVFVVVDVVLVVFVVVVVAVVVVVGRVVRYHFLNVQVGLKVEWGASAGTMRYKEGDRRF